MHVGSLFGLAYLSLSAVISFVRTYEISLWQFLEAFFSLFS
jgi:hypothetical protein